MTRDEVVALFARREEAFNQHDVATLAGQHADTGVLVTPSAGTVTGRAAIARVYQTLFTAFPDLRLTGAQLVIEGSNVVHVATTIGTDRGGFMGLPPSGKTFQLPIAFVCTLEQQLIVHERRIYDFTGLLVQIGVLKARSAQ
jgi:steroid delta-isomerase-like uncharacterized protein